MSARDYRRLLELTLAVISGKDGEVAVRGKDKFSFTFEGYDKEAVEKICQHFRRVGSVDVDCESEEVAGYTVVYIDLPK